MSHNPRRWPSQRAVGWRVFTVSILGYALIAGVIIVYVAVVAR